MSCWASWERAHSGRLHAIYIRRQMRWDREAMLNRSSEVHRARSRKTNEVYALKKIIMHNEKDGVRFRLGQFGAPSHRILI